jgi:hypothetical protein
VPASEVGEDADLPIFTTSDAGATLDFAFNGQKVQVTYSLGPEGSDWEVYLDGQPVIDPDSGNPMVIEGFNPTVRYEVNSTFSAETPGEHKLSLVNSVGWNDVDSGLLCRADEQFGHNYRPDPGAGSAGLLLSFLVRRIGPGWQTDYQRSILLALVFMRWWQCGVSS